MLKKTDLPYFISLLKTLNMQRGLNAARVWSSFHLSRISGKAIQWGMPLSLSIEPTTACNLRCPECPSGLRSFTRPTGNLDIKLYQKVVDEMSSHLIYLNFYFQGEPFIHKLLPQMIKYADAKGIYTSTSSNGHFLNDDSARAIIDSGLKRLIISIDGTTQETYENYRKGGNLDKVVEGCKTLLKWRDKYGAKTPLIVFQFLVVKPNEHQIPEILRLGKSLGVDEVMLKTAQLYDFENGNPLMPENERYARYKRLENGKYAIKNSLDNQCWKLWHSTVITWDGRVVPCCFDKDAKYEMGKVSEESFQKIWRGDRYRNFRKQLMRGRKEIDICRNCSEGTKVWS